MCVFSKTEKKKKSPDNFWVPPSTKSLFFVNNQQYFHVELIKILCKIKNNNFTNITETIYLYIIKVQSLESVDTQNSKMCLFGNTLNNDTYNLL